MKALKYGINQWKINNSYMFRKSGKSGIRSEPTTADEDRLSSAI